jgi:hypothetical protein
MSTVASRELRNDTAAVVRRVQAENLAIELVFSSGIETLECANIPTRILGLRAHPRQAMTFTTIWVRRRSRFTECRIGQTV